MSITIDLKHLIGYGACLGVLGLVVWLWHDSKINDSAQQAALAQAVAAAQDTIKKEEAQIQIRDSALQQQNTAIQKADDAAKTSQQQAVLISSIIGTKQPIIVQPTPGNQSPSNGNLVIPSTDTKQVTDFVAQCQQTENSNKVLTQDLSDKTTEITSLQTENKAQTTEITTLKGGSRWHRFLGGAKKVGIGIGIGVLVGVAAHH